MNQKEVDQVFDAAQNPDASATVAQKGVEKHPVSSSQIASIAYDHDRKVMIVEFNAGTSYEYENVDYERFKAIQNADSVGKAFNSLVKSNPTTYPFKKL